MYQKIAFLVAVLALGITAYTTTYQHGKIVSCYYSSWAFYRHGYGKFDIDDIDTDLCTHGFYGFADLDNITWEIYEYDPWFDLAPGDCEPGYCNYDGYRRFVALKERNPNFHPMLSIGGWNAGSGKYSQMAAEPAKRRSFIDSTLALAKKFGFDGIDLDWEYPGNREGTDPAADRENYSTLVEEFATTLHANGLIFTAALGCGYDKILVAYDMAFISQHFDFMNIMGYDYHGAWENFTGHNAPIFRRPEEYYEGHIAYRYNLYDTIELFIQLGTPPEKMVLGMPTYGRGVTLMDNDLNGLYCPADGGFPMGPYTRQKGTIGYMEVLQLFANTSYPYLPEAVPGEWKVVVDDCYMAPYTYNGPYWMSYDDPESISYKVQYANFMEFGGVMIWSIETDDFGGFYSDVTYPLLRRMNEELVLGKKYDPKKTCGNSTICDDYTPPEYTRTPPPTTPQPTSPVTPDGTTDDGGNTTPGGGDSTTNGYEGACRADLEVHPYPGDCHKYYRCFADGNGGYTITVYTCGGPCYVFNPNELACVDPAEPGNENICGGQSTCTPPLHQ